MGKTKREDITPTPTNDTNPIQSNKQKKKKKNKKHSDQQLNSTESQSQIQSTAITEQPEIKEEKPDEVVQIKIEEAEVIQESKKKHKENTKKKGETQKEKEKSSTKKKNKTIVEDESESFFNVMVKQYLTLSPKFANDLNLGIDGFLNGFVMKYMPQVNGVVLAHSDTRPLQSKGKMLNESPFINFWITTNFLVWRPKVGSLLTGIINIQSADHIGLVIHNTFNASISKADIPEEFYKFKAEHGEYSAGEWVSKKDNQPIVKNGELQFYVKALHYSNDILSISGTLSKP